MERALAAGADPNRPLDLEGTIYSLLVYAAGCVREEIFRTLLTHGATFLNNTEEFEIFVAAGEYGYLGIVRILLNAGRVGDNSLSERGATAHVGGSR